MFYLEQPTQHDLIKDVQSFQHPTTHIVDSEGRIIDWSALTGPPPDSTPRRFSISGDFKTVTTTLQPLTATSRLCKAVQIQSVRQNLSDNVGRVGLGNENGWLVAIGPMGVQQFEAPINGVLDLADIYFLGTNAGDQIVYMVMELD